MKAEVRSQKPGVRNNRPSRPRRRAFRNAAIREQLRAAAERRRLGFESEPVGLSSPPNVGEDTGAAVVDAEFWGGRGERPVSPAAAPV